MASSLPTVGIQPLFQTTEPNAPITLYHGDITAVHPDKKSITGQGIIQWRWLISPGLFAEVQLANVHDAYDTFMSTELNLHISGFEPVNFLLTGFETDDRARIEGRAKGFFRPLFLQPLKELCFHVPNFPDYHGSGIAHPNQDGFYFGRMEMSFDGWQVTLDSLPETTKTIKKLDSVGGYAITHVGRICRTLNEDFSLEEAQDFIKRLGFFLTFVAGRWCQPILWWIPASEGNQLQILTPTSCRLDSWTKIYSWANLKGHNSAGHISSLFPQFMARYRTAPELLKLSISWYVEALSDKLVSDSRIVLTQVALELLGGTLPPLLGHKVKGKAEHRVRNLLAMTVPTVSPAVPAELTRLTALLTKSPFTNWNKGASGVVDGPSVLVSVRNKIAHSTNDVAEKALLSNSLVMYEVSQLGLWQLELVLLGWFGYVGKYRSRLNMNGWTNEGEDFPSSSAH